jgi:hypothetical protein
MKQKIFIILICFLCISCGIKSDPEYKSQIIYNKTIKLI